MIYTDQFEIDLEEVLNSIMLSLNINRIDAIKFIFRYAQLSIIRDKVEVPNNLNIQNTLDNLKQLNGYDLLEKLLVEDFKKYSSRSKKLNPET